MRDVLREEKKFFLDQAAALALRAHLRPVLHADAHNGADGYPVRSLYFDTPDERDFCEKEDGVELRRKLRLRVYSPTADFALFEMKQKQGRYQRKRSLRLPRDAAQALIVRANRNCSDGIEGLVFRAFERRAVLRVKNTGVQNVEYIYEFSRKALERAQREFPTLTDDFYALGDVESVNFVAQSDVIYN